MISFWNTVKKIYSKKKDEDFPCIARVLDVKRKKMKKLIGRHVIVLDKKNEYDLYPIKTSEEFPPPPGDCEHWYIGEEGLEFLPK